MAGLAMPSAAEDSPSPFQPLVKRLVADGFDSQRMEAIFSSPEVSFAKRGVSAYFMHNEAKLNYKQFLDEQNLALARQYLAEGAKVAIFARRPELIEEAGLPVPELGICRCTRHGGSPDSVSSAFAK